MLKYITFTQGAVNPHTPLYTVWAAFSALGLGEMTLLKSHESWPGVKQKVHFLAVLIPLKFAQLTKACTKIIL